MKIQEKLQWFVFPGLSIILLGMLAIKFPHAMDGFDDGYTGRGAAGVILLLFELFVMVTWGKISGAIAILLGSTTIVLGLWPKSSQSKPPVT